MRRQDDARSILVSIGQPPATVLWALRAEIGLSDLVISGLVDRSAQTVRRWRKGRGSVEIPDIAVATIDDLRAIVAMLIAANYDGSTIKSYLLSRNTGLGQDRPLDGLRVGVGAFRRVKHVTDCFIAGIAPEPGSALTPGDDEEIEPAFIQAPDPEPGAPRVPVGSRK